MTQSNCFSAIHEILRETFQPVEMNLQDESFRHKGHAEAKKSGGGHLNLLIVSSKFDGVPLMERHRLVYDTVWSSDRNFPVHALSLKTLTPKEWASKNENQRWTK